MIIERWITHQGDNKMRMTIEERINKYLISEEDEQGYVCTECGKKFDEMPEDEECPKCGGDVEEMDSEEESDDEEEEKEDDKEEEKE